MRNPPLQGVILSSVTDWIVGDGRMSSNKVILSTFCFLVSVPALSVLLNHFGVGGGALWPVTPPDQTFFSLCEPSNFRVSPSDCPRASESRAGSGQLVYVGQEALGPPFIQIYGHEIWEKRVGNMRSRMLSTQHTRKLPNEWNQ